MRSPPSAPSRRARRRDGTSDRCRTLLLLGDGRWARRPAALDRAEPTPATARPPIPATMWACPQGSSPVKHQAQKASAMSAVQSSPEVQSGLEGVVAFATEIAEPDREGGALRYRGVDIENLVGAV